MAKVLYIGDWAVALGPIFAETPFNYAFKGLETYRYDHYLRDAIESSGTHSCDTMPTWDFYAMKPGEYEQALQDYDVIVFSDVELKNFQLAPQFFDRKVFGEGIITYPDRVRLTVEAVESGLRVMFMGGWLSFSGEMGKGGWGRSRLAEVLPVTCLETEDLVESTEGFHAQATGSAVLSDVDLGSMPPLLGYNRVMPREDATVHVTVRETGDPLLATMQHGSGATLAFTSDPAPHWGCNLVQWEQYQSFWVEALDYLLGLR
ncbi:MAG: glutamine amidotransferase [Acidimicrobiia bacterium]|nr:glutamine amidotransferase [Acidimicrobiia bacterium]MDX2468884.1 glutamine amidotransferase [Acidimicrobiia bacterium]